MENKIIRTNKIKCRKCGDIQTGRLSENQCQIGDKSDPAKTVYACKLNESIDSRHERIIPKI